MKLFATLRRRLVEAEYLPATRINYERWARRYARFIAPVHPRQAGQAGVAKYITHLAVECNLSGSSQNQALDALVFLYDCLEIPIDTRGLRAKVGRRLQTTASPGEILPVIEALPDRERLMALLIYGSGLSLQQAAALRMEQVDLVAGLLRIGKHGRPLARRCIEPLGSQIDAARGWPGNVAGYVFPSSRIAGGRCWHVSPASLQKALASAQRGSARRITPRVLRASFVAGLLDRYDVKTVQEVCGYADIGPLVRRQEQARRLREVVSPYDALFNNVEKEGY